MEVETRTETLAAAIARALGLVSEGSVIGVGAGSASTAFLRSLATRVDDGFRVEIVAASEEIADLARELGVPVGDVRGGIDLTIDGADEVSPHGAKGGQAGVCSRSTRRRLSRTRRRSRLLSSAKRLREP